MSGIKRILIVQYGSVHGIGFILTGDTKQHHSVQWGDALRILERSGAISQAALTKIYRQKVPGLREAIEDLSRGRTGERFDKLEKFGVIHEIADGTGNTIAPFSFGAMRCRPPESHSRKANRGHRRSEIVFDHRTDTWGVQGYSRRCASSDER
jgi:hypothetical protein